MKYIITIFAIFVMATCNGENSDVEFDSSKLFFQSMSARQVSDLANMIEVREKAEALSIGYLRDLNLQKPPEWGRYYYSYSKKSFVLIKLDGRYGMVMVHSEWNNPAILNPSSVLETRKEGQWIIHLFRGNPFMVGDRDRGQ